MCQSYSHEKLRLNEDFAWTCEACGRKWEYGNLPLIVLENG